MLNGKKFNMHKLNKQTSRLAFTVFKVKLIKYNFIEALKFFKK